MKQCLPTPFMMWTETRPAKERWRLPHSNYMPQGFGDLIFPAWPLPLAPSQVTSGLVSSVLTSIPKFPIVAAYHTWVFWWHFDHTQSWTHDPYSKALSSFSCCFYFGWCRNLPPSLGCKSPNRPSPLLHVSLPLENQPLFCSQCRGWSHPSPHFSFYSGHVAHGLSSHSIPLAAVIDAVIYTVGPTTLSPKTGSWTQWSLNWKFFMLIHPGSSPWRDCLFAPAPKSRQLLWFPFFLKLRSSAILLIL